MIGHLTNSDPACLCAQEELGGFHRVERKIEVMRERVCGTKRNNAEGDVAAREALQNVMYGAVASAGDDRVITVCDGVSRLLSGFSVWGGGEFSNFDARSSQNIGRGSDVRLAVL